MIELLTSLSLTQVAIYIFLIMVAVKEICSLFSFFNSHLKKHYDEDSQEKITIETIHNKLKGLEDRAKKQEERDTKIEEKLHFLEIEAKQRMLYDQRIQDQITGFQDSLARQDKELQLLKDSDRDDIRSWIVQQYHYFCETKKWIDDFSMDALERRYAHYVDEGGNSYVSSLMDQIRSLPHQPPRD